MQPLHKADDCRYVRARLGENRLGGTFAFRKLLEAGAVLAFGSDWPVVSCDPLLGIRTAITGLTFDGDVFGTDQNLTVEESLRGYTRDAAFCLGMNLAGVLTPGMYGDLVIFDHDPFVADWVNSRPRVVMTVSGGQVVHNAVLDDATRHASAGTMGAMVAK
jgi:predicted amidohydrolase YtcJ